MTQKRTPQASSQGQNEVRKSKTEMGDPSVRRRQEKWAGRSRPGLAWMCTFRAGAKNSRSITDGP